MDIHHLKRLSTPRVWNVNQSWYFEAHWTLDGRMLRVAICRNAYDDQSYARVDILDSPKNQWNTLNSMPIKMMTCHKISYVNDNITPKNFGADEETLLHEAQLLLLGPELEEAEDIVSKGVNGIKLNCVFKDSEGLHFEVWDVALDGEGDLLGYGDLWDEDGIGYLGGTPSVFEDEEIEPAVEELAFAWAAKLGMKVRRP